MINRPSPYCCGIGSIMLSMRSSHTIAHEPCADLVMLSSEKMLHASGTELWHHSWGIVCLQLYVLRRWYQDSGVRYPVVRGFGLHYWLFVGSSLSICVKVTWWWPINHRTRLVLRLTSLRKRRKLFSFLWRTEKRQSLCYLGWTLHQMPRKDSLFR